MMWERSPAKKINALLSVEWEVLTFGQSQGDPVRHQIRSQQKDAVRSLQTTDLFFFILQ